IEFSFPNITIKMTPANFSLAMRRNQQMEESAGESDTTALVSISKCEAGRVTQTRINNFGKANKREAYIFRRREILLPISGISLERFT
ncbi:MAG TPA: hypothetical protein VFL34_12905, partial [Candidatus Sulfotelmatobacter sp.]|nr:hypothetical protein [Candidatus Sulfotelmatobacter sp.]